ncbi:MAG: Hpt domain-containing protein [Neisseriaceae bacterium]|nr:Hpt domain-containing protein [Neisseriaceae bacterium]MBR3425549.1 Hpt domain-containing protein [Neisseriaceae bacterium]
MADKNKYTSEESLFSKYGMLILSIAGFLLLIVILSLATYYYTNKITQETQKVALVGEQGEITQEIARIAFSQESYLTNEVFRRYQKDGKLVNRIPLEEFPQNTLFRRTEMKRLADRYNEILLRLEHGGEIADRHGNIITITPVQLATTRANLEATKQMWDYYYPLMTEFELEAETGYLTRDYATYVMEYTRQYNRTLQRDTSRVSSLIQAYVDRLQKELFWIQTAGVVLALALFFLMIFGTIRRLIEGDRRLGIARRETEEILETINEGLFLVDRDLNIGHQYSAHLENIIGQRDIGGKKLNEVLSKLVDKETMEVTETFIEQLYSDWVVEDLIDDLNPLHRIRVEVDDFSGYYETRYLDFNFSRVYEGEAIDKVLCSVSDITNAVVLEEKLAAEREQNDRQIEMLGTILAAEPTMLDNFIKTTKRRINDINSALRRPERGQAALQEKAKLIFREAHSMKGEASALKLASFVSQCESFENKIKELQSNPRLTGNDFLGLTVMLDEIMSLSDVVANLNDRISGGRTSSGGTVAAPSNVMKKYFNSFAADIAERNGKKVALDCQGMDDDMLSGSLQDTIKDIAVQMLRNAIVHGIEDPLDRKRDGKPEAGNVQLLLTRRPGNMAELLVEDDGSGIHFDKIRQRLVEKGTCTEDEAREMQKRELIMHLFDSGLSTAEEGNQDAGRGVGMDIVRERIAEIKGKLKIASEEGQYTRFTVTFPLGV